MSHTKNVLDENNPINGDVNRGQTTKCCYIHRLFPFHSPYWVVNYWFDSKCGEPNTHDVSIRAKMGFETIGVFRFGLKFDMSRGWYRFESRKRLSRIWASTQNHSPTKAKPTFYPTLSRVRSMLGCVLNTRGLDWFHSQQPQIVIVAGSYARCHTVKFNEGDSYWNCHPLVVRWLFPLTLCPPVGNVFHSKWDKSEANANANEKKSTEYFN